MTRSMQIARDVGAEIRQAGPVAAIGAQLVLAVVVIVFAAGAGQALAGSIASTTATVTTVAGIAGEEVTLTITPGESAQTIAGSLEELGVVNADDFLAASEAAGVTTRLQIGTFHLRTGMEVEDVLNKLAGAGTDRYMWVTIPEGLRVTETLHILADTTPHSYEAYVAALTSGEVTSPHVAEGDDIGDLATWEGVLFGDTYQFAASQSATEILQRLSDTQTSKENSLDIGRLDELGVDRDQMLTIASLIEAEAKTDGDRPLIASVIYNRLAADMPLGLDSSVAYAVGKRGHLDAVDLITDSPYNTRRYPGLPPGPICSPSAKSLQAAADPAETGYLYFVLASTDGTHAFADTYDEFLALKQRARDAGLLP